jgi:hypothetical protein
MVKLKGDKREKGEKGDKGFKISSFRALAWSADLKE